MPPAYPAWSGEEPRETEVNGYGDSYFADDEDGTSNWNGSSECRFVVPGDEMGWELGSQGSGASDDEEDDDDDDDTSPLRHGASEADRIDGGGHHSEEIHQGHGDDDSDGDDQDMAVGSGGGYDQKGGGGRDNTRGITIGTSRPSQRCQPTSSAVVEFPLTSQWRPPTTFEVIAAERDQPPPIRARSMWDLICRYCSQENHDRTITRCPWCGQNSFNPIPREQR